MVSQAGDWGFSVTGVGIGTDDLLFSSDLLRQVGDVQVGLPHVGLLLLLLLLLLELRFGWLLLLLWPVDSAAVLVASLLDPPLVFSPHSCISLVRGAWVPLCRNLRIRGRGGVP